jgi:hypothetical protein
MSTVMGRGEDRDLQFAFGLVEETNTLPSGDMEGKENR